MVADRFGQPVFEVGVVGVEVFLCEGLCCARRMIINGRGFMKGWTGNAYSDSLLRPRQKIALGGSLCHAVIVVVDRHAS